MCTPCYHNTTVSTRPGKLVCGATPREIMHTLCTSVYRFCVTYDECLCSVSQLPGWIIATGLLLSPAGSAKVICKCPIQSYWVMYMTGQFLKVTFFLWNTTNYVFSFKLNINSEWIETCKKVHWNSKQVNGTTHRNLNFLFDISISESL